MTAAAALLLADLTGVAIFAASGASAAVVKRLDLFGVVFVGFVAALGGGIFRDLVIGDGPPLAFADWRYAVTATVTATAVFWLHPQLTRLRTTVLVLDAAGLGLFTVTGTLIALDAGLPPLGAGMIGMMAGIGGGLGRDLLTGEIPVVLRREIYALAALAGAVAVVGLDRAGLARPAPLMAAALFVFALRLLALRRRWSAPVPTDRPAGGDSGPPHRRVEGERLPDRRVEGERLPDRRVEGERLPDRRVEGGGLPDRQVDGGAHPEGWADGERPAEQDR